MNTIPYSSVTLTDGFWKEKQNLICTTTLPAVFDQFASFGRMDAFHWNGDESVKPHFFWDSDLAKLIEAVAYFTQNGYDTAALRKIADAYIDDLAQAQEESGYVNVYYQMVDPDPDHRFQNRDRHELYCLGHLIEAAVAYQQTTGSEKLMNVVKKYTDYVIERFVVRKDTGFDTPGHEELELALVRLYDFTGDEKYLNLARHFIDLRGCSEKDAPVTDWARITYNQSHLPVRQQTTAEGHAVRAPYLYSAMADLALRTGDKELREACETIFSNILNRRSYVTGGIGSSKFGEAFTVDYDLPNETAYSETCAAIALMMFARRMSLLSPDRVYDDLIERILYNAFLSGLSKDGKAFFYENPLEIQLGRYERNVSLTSAKEGIPKPERSAYFRCSCCPTNVVRAIGSIADYLYSVDETTVYLHQYMASRAAFSINGQNAEIEQETAYPNNGKLKIKILRGSFRLAVRIPGWCKSYRGETAKGFAFFDVSAGDELSFDFTMQPRFLRANPRVGADAGKCALQYGPRIYCMEGVDNVPEMNDLYLNADAEFTPVFNAQLNDTALLTRAYRHPYSNERGLYEELNPETIEHPCIFIPYASFANRGRSDMRVWFPVY